MRLVLVVSLLAACGGSTSTTDPPPLLITSGSDPAEIFGARLITWLDADDASSLDQKDGMVTAWHDRSPLGLAAGLRSAGWQRPFVSSIERTDHAPLGHGALDIVAQLAPMAYATVLGIPIPQPRASVVCVIASFRNDDVQPALLFGGSYGYVGLLGNTDGTVSVRYNGTTVSLGGKWNDGQFHAFTVMSDSESTTVRVDGHVAYGAGSWQWPKEILLGGYFTDCSEGCQIGMFDMIDGEIAEVIVAKDPTYANIGALAGYVRAKYDLPL